MSGYTLSTLKCYSFFFVYYDAPESTRANYRASMYTPDYRHIATRLYEVFHSLRRTAIIMQVSHSSVARWIAEPYRTRAYKTHIAHKTQIVATSVRCAVQVNPFFSVRDIRDIVFKATHVYVSASLVCSVINALGLSKKKARFHARPPYVQERILHFLRVRDELRRNNVPLVAVDETSFGIIATRGRDPCAGE